MPNKDYNLFSDVHLSDIAATVVLLFFLGLIAVEFTVIFGSIGDCIQTLLK